METRRKTLREKVIEKELKIYFYRKLEHSLIFEYILIVEEVYRL